MRKHVGMGLLAALFVALFFMAQGMARASAVPLSLPTGVSAAGSAFQAMGPGITFSGAAFNSGLTTQVSGKLVTVPATWRLASNAGQVAVGALRATPGLGTAAVLAWLVSYGIEKCVDGSWCHRTAPVPPAGSDVVWSSTGWKGDPGTACGGSYGCTAEQAMAGNMPTSCGASGFVLYAITLQTSTQAIGKCRRVSDGALFNISPILRQSPYVAPTGDPVPAVDSDWMSPAAGVLPDSVLNALIDSVSLPVMPTVNPAAQKVPLGDPYIDPVSGKRYQDVAYVTPSPSAPAKTADVQLARQEIDANGNPVIDPTTGQPKNPEQSDNFNDVPFGDIPKLYTQKYPNGISGVWNDSKPDITNTDFYNGIKSMFPNFGAGSCPVWHMSFNLGAAGNFGSGDLSVPCWIFQALGLVILATAAFTARKILF